MSNRIKFPIDFKIPKGAKLTAILKSKDRELIRTSHIVSFDNFTNFIILKEDIEKQVTLGDLPAAHFPEN